MNFQLRRRLRDKKYILKRYTVSLQRYLIGYFLSTFQEETFQLLHRSIKNNGNCCSPRMLLGTKQLVGSEENIN